MRHCPRLLGLAFALGLALAVPSFQSANAQADAKFNGADLLLRELSTGLVRNIGNVNLYEFDDAGRFLAYTVDAADKMGNGVYLLDPAIGQARALDTAAADYDQLVWSAEGTKPTPATATWCFSPTWSMKSASPARRP